MKNEAILDDLETHRASLDAGRVRLENELRDLVQRRGLQIQFINSRTKSAESLRRKIARPDKTYARLHDVTDLIGIRIATYFEDTIDDVARLIEEHYRVDFTHSTDKLRFTDHGKFGYRSLHYVCVAPEGLDPSPGLRFEVQVRTALQHAWAEVEHDLGYKASETVPEVIRRRFSRIASLLEIADQEFVSIRADLARYQERVRAELLHPSGPLPLDVVSLAELVRGDAVAALDAAVASALGKPVGEEPYFPEYLVKMLKGAGLLTTRDVQDAVVRHGQAALRAVAPYFRFAAETWQLDAGSIDAVQRGYSLFFLAHVVILEGSELGISKVAKLAQLYQQLDYPGDERTAQRIASGLATALAADLGPREQTPGGQRE